MTEFEPKILVLSCNWCTYAGSDLAGSLNYEYPANVRIIRVMCSGRMDPAFIMKALATKADAVVVSGCHPGDCHYQNGNFKHQRRMKILKRMLIQLGLEPERLQMFWISAAESKEFQETMIKVVNDIKELGPNPLLKTAPMVIPVE